MTDAPTSATLVTGVDFVAVPARDFDASVDFYGKVLVCRSSSGGAA
jgi:hypothetical protein